LKRIRAFPRLHLGLHDLGKATPRKYGGSGFTLSWPTTDVSAELYSCNVVINQAGLDAQAIEDVAALIERSQSIMGFDGMRVTIREVPPQHVGFGTKTTLLLAVATACASESNAAMTASDLQIVSRRGGTSGVGIHTFFNGGFIVDAGHHAPYDVEWSPSSASIPAATPLLVLQHPIPNTWRFSLVLPQGRRLAGHDEAEFFRLNTPIPVTEAYRSISLTYHGIVPSVLESRLDLLKQTLAESHRVGFKARELNGQSAAVRAVFAELERIDQCAVGLSSLGPLVYVVHDASDHLACKLIREVTQRCGAKFLGSSYGINHGYEEH
jgi:beta-ribofuranosylaminobenzene 5'-phosphate synthase